MPTIPLFQDGQGVRSARITPPNLARTHQVVYDIAGAARNFAAPSIPYQLADNRGGIALGRAVGGVADLLEQRALKQAEAINIRQAAEADMVMESAYAEFEAWKMQNPDETKWAGEWQNQLGSLRSNVLTESLSPKAAEDIGMRFDLFSNKSLSNVQTSAAKTSFQKAGETLTAQALRAYDSGDFEGGDSYIDEGVKRNYIAGDTAARMQIAAKNEAESKQRGELKNLVSAAIDGRRIDEAKALVAGAPFLKDHEKKATLADIGARAEAAMQADEVQALTLTRPADAVAALNDPAKFDKLAPGDRQAMIVRAKEIQAGRAVEAFRDIKARIELGQVKPDEVFEGPGMESLTPLMRDVLKSYNGKRAQEGAMNDPVGFQRAETDIDSYSPKEGDALKRAQFEAFLETKFSGPYLDTLKKKWMDKTSSPASLVETAEAFEALDKWAFDDERFGKFKEPVLDKDGKPVMSKRAGGYTFDKTKGLDFWGLRDTGEYVQQGLTFEPEMKMNPRERDRIAKVVSDIKETIRREVKGGKLMDSNGVFKRMAELAKMPVTTKAAAEVDYRTAPNPLLPPIDSTTPETISDIKKRHAKNP